MLRKTIAILLLFAFAAAQYDRYVGFMECKVGSYFSTDNAKCDCEKILQKTGAADEKPGLPATHSHHHTDQLYYPSAALIHTYPEALFGGHIISTDRLLPEGMNDHIDHPPPTDYSFLLFV